MSYYSKDNMTITTDIIFQVIMCVTNIQWKRETEIK